MFFSQYKNIGRQRGLPFLDNYPRFIKNRGANRNNTLITDAIWISKIIVFTKILFYLYLYCLSFLFIMLALIFSFSDIKTTWWDYIFSVPIRENKIIHVIPLEYDRKLLTGWKCTKDVFLLFVVVWPFFFITPDMLLITQAAQENGKCYLKTSLLQVVQKHLIIACHHCICLSPLFSLYVWISNGQDLTQSTLRWIFSWLT